MRIYTTRNYLTARSFVKEVLDYCENEPKFIVDKAPWLIKALKSLGLEYEHKNFWEALLNPFFRLSRELNCFSARLPLNYPQSSNTFC
ncbi:MAG: hypothetical protein ABWW66_05580 [Archaeoglobaceae archaeon]